MTRSATSISEEIKSLTRLENSTRRLRLGCRKANWTSSGRSRSSSPSPVGRLSRTCPVGSEPSFCRAWRADSTSRAMRAPCSYSTVPCCVSSRRRVVRRISCAPKARSSFCRFRLTCDRVTPWRSAASLRVPASTMVTNSWIRFRSSAGRVDMGVIYCCL
ncbi:hypothetical protein D3C85_1124470 [compost metagenome]